MRDRSRKLFVLATTLAVSSYSAGVTSVWGQESKAQTVTIVAGEEYSAGGMHKLIFGDSYRDIWTTPIEVELLDLSAVGGGLTPVRQVGRLQTRGLAIAGADGKSYTFREVNKDPTAILDPELLNTAIADIAQDQISSNMPGSSIVAGPIAFAAGVRQVLSRLVVMPDDPRLGQFREEFAGLLGTFEEYPTPPTFGSEEVIGGREMWDRMTASSAVRVDSREMLRARLVDLLLGDWDRHVEQWRFARVPDNPFWVPIPEDRDQAFSRFGGIAMNMAKDREPKFDEFGPDYQGLEGLTWNARSVDRRLLVGIERETYREVATEIRGLVTDEVIEAAVREMPPEYFELQGERLIRDLKSRRDQLVEEADRFYEFLAGQVDVRTTNSADWIEMQRGADGSVTVMAAPIESATAGACEAVAGEPFFRRTFLSSETKDLRIYTGGGDDLVVISGADGGIRTHVIGGAGNNLLCDQRSGRTFAFDMSSQGQGGRGPKVSRKIRLAPSEPIEETGTPAQSQGRALTARRNWGSTSYRQPWFGYSPDIGVFLGMGLIKENYSFRKRPYASQQQVRLGFSFGALRPRLDYNGNFRRENRRWYFNVRALASGVETLNFYGYGNDTPQADDRDVNRVQQSTLGAEFRVAMRFGEDVTLSGGPLVRYSVTDTDDPGRLISVLQPYGSEDIGQVGLVAGFSFNSREFAGAPDVKGSDDVFRWGPPAFGTGYTVDIDAHFYPQAWRLQDDYGLVEGAATAAYWVQNLGVGFGFRIGGQYNWGTVPYYDAAFLGARRVRGLRANRFAGDSVVYANAGMFARIGRLTLMIPGRWGLFARADTGRVWLEGEDSDTWHWGLGGGLWWSPWDFQNALRVFYAESDQGAQFYVLMGFGF